MLGEGRLCAWPILQFYFFSESIDQVPVYNSFSPVKIPSTVFLIQIIQLITTLCRPGESDELPDLLFQPVGLYISFLRC